MSQAAQTPEPYYANEDIEVLHEIITEAQETIDEAKDPKPFPVQALFRAYDRVLPQHGIDPDSDHHLSTFIFRVGGERGELSLLDKFHAILERMGIVLEFGDGDTASAASTHSLVAPGRPILPSNEIDRPITGGGGAREPFDSRRLFSHISMGNREPNGIRIPPQAMQKALPEAFNQRPEIEIETEAGINNQSFPPPHSIPKAAVESITPLVSNDEPENEQQQTADQASLQLLLHSPQQELREVFEENEEDEAPVAPRPSILTLLDRWGAAAGRRKNSQQTLNTLSPLISGPTVRDFAYARSGDTQQGRAQPPRIVGSLQGAQHTLQDSSQNLEPSPHKAAWFGPEPIAPQARDQSPSRESSARAAPQTPYRQETSDRRQSFGDEREHERLLQLACRAREIFVASRAFNHWADKTARRLEREAVARRHMIRFRCFRGWCQGPSSQGDEAHRLKATTAVQKLRRAVAEHEEQLRQAALAASQSRRLRIITGALDIWTRHKTESNARLQLIKRSRVKAAAEWLTKANEHRGMERYASKRHTHYSGVKVTATWSHQADNLSSRDSAARAIGEHRASIACLAQWWDQAELRRRASDFHRSTLLEKACHWFEQWNLQVRRQAFIWRSEYVAVRKSFEVWQRSAQEDQWVHVLGKQKSESRLKAKYCSSLITDADKKRQLLEHLSSRACLYIMSNRLLSVFEQAVEKRKAERWEAVKRHLSARYEQVSAAKKRRKFFSTLDRWRSAAAISQVEADQASRIREARELASRSQVLSSWLDESALSERRHYKAQLYHTLPTLAAWNTFSQEQEDMSVQAIDLIRTGKRIQYQKRWSISALQHGGLAHTASMVAQRYQRDQRKKALHHWRQHNDKGKPLALASLSQHGRRLGASESFKSALRLPHQRTWATQSGSDVRRQSTGTFETPTRWTGQPLAMGSLFTNQPMPPVREADEEHTPTPSNLGDDDVVKSPLRRIRNVKIMTAPRPTTTPRAPVPLHVEEEFRAQFQPTASRSLASNARSTGQETPFVAPRPSRQDPGSAAAVTGLLETPDAVSAGYSQSQPAMTRPVATWSGRPAASLVRTSRPLDASQSAQRREGTPPVAGTGKASPKNSILSGTSRNKRWDLSKPYNSRMR